MTDPIHELIIGMSEDRFIKLSLSEDDEVQLMINDETFQPRVRDYLPGAWVDAAMSEGVHPLVLDLLCAICELFPLEETTRD